MGLVTCALHPILDFSSFSCEKSLGQLDQLLDSGKKETYRYTMLDKIILYSLKAFIYDMAAGTWTGGSSMAREARASQCGVITHPGSGKKEVIVAGGIFSALTTIYDIDNDEWREGPPLPEVRFWGTAVPVGNTFLIVGGSNQGQATQTAIWKYNIGNNGWDVMGKFLAAGRNHFSAFWVPDDHACSVPA